MQNLLCVHAPIHVGHVMFGLLVKFLSSVLDELIVADGIKGSRPLVTEIGGGGLRGSGQLRPNLDQAERPLHTARLHERYLAEHL